MPVWNVVATNKVTKLLKDGAAEADRIVVERILLQVNGVVAVDANAAILVAAQRLVTIDTELCGSASVVAVKVS